MCSIRFEGVSFIIHRKIEIFPCKVRCTTCHILRTAQEFGASSGAHTQPCVPPACRISCTLPALPAVYLCVPSACPMHAHLDCQRSLVQDSVLHNISTMIKVLVCSKSLVFNTSIVIMVGALAARQVLLRLVVNL